MGKGSKRANPALGLALFFILWAIIITLYVLLSPICHILMILCPPVAILIQGCFEDDYGIFDFLGKKNEDPNASFGSRIPGFVRGFLFCLILTCLGWIPGVIYAFISVYAQIFIAIRHNGLCGE